jgi:opacity protein-like surface antigen
VIVANASIRLKPDLQSEIIKISPLGSVFEVVAKSGDWYEIRIKTDLGAFVPGFIHEMVVEPVGTEQAVPVPIKKIPEPKKKIVRVSPPPIKTNQNTSNKRVDIALRAGYMTGYSLTNTASYSDSFSSGSLQNATSNGKIMMGLKNPFSLDGELNFFFLKGLGLQLRFDSNSSAKFTDDSLSSFDMSWAWTLGGSGTESVEWDATGKVSLFVFSGNLVYKIGSGGFLTPVLSGGISLFSGKAAVNTTGAYATTWLAEGMRYIDYFMLPADVDASLSGIGLNVGGGFDLNFTSNIALSIDVRYFIKSKVEEPWVLQAGKYTSNLNSGWTLTLDQEDIDELQAEITPFSLNPSFLKIAAGIKIRF